MNSDKAVRVDIRDLRIDRTCFAWIFTALLLYRPARRYGLKKQG